MKTTNLDEKIDTEYFITIKNLANILGVSISWIRLEQQRRRKGLPHTIDIDPVMVGAMPRYTREDVTNLLDRLVEQRNKEGGNE